MRGSIPPEGGAALEEKELSGGRGANDGDEDLERAEGISPVRATVEDDEALDEIEKVPANVEKGNTVIPTEGAESDCDASPQKENPPEVSALLERIVSLEGKIQKLETNLGEKINVLTDAVEREGNDGTDLANIIHSLCHQLDNNVQSASYIENKILPLKTVLNNGMHRRCVGKFIVDKLVRSLGNGGPVDPKMLNDVAKVIRIVLYSKGVEGKKDKKAVDDEDLDFRLREMKCRMTWTIVNYIQNTANVGTQTVCFGDDIRVVNKPYWME